MQELQKLLKKITTSKNYSIENSCGYRLYYSGKNIPCGCVQYGREQLVYFNSYNEMKHFLVAAAKYRKLTTVCTKNYLDNMGYLFGQCQSHLAYGHKFEGSQYIGEINLPYDLKKLVYGYVQSAVAENGYAGTDSEGNDYNYLKLTEV